MSERVDWQADGTPEGSPFNPRFHDRYRSEQGGIDQAREVFLKGCGLPGLWAGQQHWCILENGFGLGLNFLVAWQAWKAAPERPRLLHFVSTEAYPVSAADILRAAAAQPQLLPLAEQLAAQFWGLLPGVHRLVFEDGLMLLTLLVGDAKAMLRKQHLQADSLYLDGFSPDRNPDMWDLQVCKALARCCRRGARLATWTVARSVREALTQSGFVVEKAPGVAPKRDSLQGEFNPHWPLRHHALTEAVRGPARCVVIGAGLAGAAVAASLARRGWSVVVLDAAATAASGASSLPAGVLAAHVSPDDSVLSRLSRSGVRATLQQLEARLQAGRDWHLSGVLELSLGDSPRRPPAAWLTDAEAGGQDDIAQAAQEWLLPANAAQLADCQLAAKTPALWHVRAAWVKPAVLVQSWLSTPGVQFQADAQAARLVCISRTNETNRTDGINDINDIINKSATTPENEVWQVLDSADRVLSTAELVVLAAGTATATLVSSAQWARSSALKEAKAEPAEADSPAAGEASARSPAPSPSLQLPRALALQAVRGQVLWGWHLPPAHNVNPVQPRLPAFPVNGSGSLIATLPMAGGTDDAQQPAWLFGATYERANADVTTRAEDDETNKSRLRQLLPDLAETLLQEKTSAAAPTQSWAGVRCTTPNRLPALGPLQAQTRTGERQIESVWLCAGMGSRGLSFAALCAEVLAARLHAEPMPLEDRLVNTLLQRYMPPATR